ncbi:MAG: PepSY domain-containing protein [Pyrinomonadaceae bacterium MAG19_C2-C3]|nr:PepSY domain-containing protein [Pyrinomonadaceae bacterium MAG19_C2-C3]
MRAQTTRKLWQWHKWTGLVTGIFILFLSVTGTVAVFKYEIDWLVTPALRVQANDGAPYATLDAALKNVRAAYPSHEVQSVNLAPGKRTAHTFSITNDDVYTEVFVNPYTAEVTGARTGENLANVIRQAHVRFYFFGWQGRVLVGIFGLTLLISTVTGLLIYAPFMRAVFVKGLRFWQIRRSDKLKIKTADWHKLIGIIALAFNLIIAVTGAVLGLENLSRYSKTVQNAIYLKPRADINPPSSLDNALTPDAALQQAMQSLPDFAPTSFELPIAGESHYVFSGNINRHFASQNMSYVVINALDGSPVDVHDARRAAPVKKLYNLNEPLHFGDFGGIILKILYALFGFTSALLAASGYLLMYLKRRQNQTKTLTQNTRLESEARHIASVVN